MGRTQFCGAVLLNLNSTSALHSLHNCEWCVSMSTSCLFVMESGEPRDNILQEDAAPSAAPFASAFHMSEGIVLRHTRRLTLVS